MRWGAWAACLLPLACAAALHASGPSGYAAKVGIFVGIGALQAMSLNMIWGFGGQFSMGQMMLTAIGAYVSALAVTLWGLDPYLALLPALGAAMAVTLVLGGLALRLRGFQFAIVTLAVSQVLLVVLYNAEAVGGQSGLVIGYALPDITVGGVRLLRMDPAGTALFAGGVVSLLMLGQTAVLRSRAGRAIVAVREEEVLARSVGIGPTPHKILAFVLSAVPACVAGWLSAPVVSYLSTSAYGIEALLDQICMVVIGGTGTVLGPFAGALVVVVLPEVLRFAGALRIVGYSVVLILVVIFAPRGLAGLAAAALPRRREREVPGVARGRAATVGEPGLPLLALDGVTKRYAGLVAVSGVTLTVEAGEAVGLIGPNGAGKTTLFDMVSGFSRPSAGRVRFLGQEGLRPERLARAGLVRTFQHARLFPHLTVRENLLTAAHLPGRGLFGAADGPAAATGRVAQVLALSHLAEWAETPAAQLPYGVGKRLGVALGLIAEPRLLMLDEPAAGLTLTERQALAGLLERIGALGITLLVIEHDIGFVAQVCRRVVVLAAGEVICDGTIADARANKDVVDAYLGPGEHGAGGRGGGERGAGEAPVALGVPDAAG